MRARASRAYRAAGACSLLLAGALSGCSDAAHNAHLRRTPGAQGAVRAAGPGRPPARPGLARALVTAEAKNRLYVVDLRSGRVTGAIALAMDPENVVSQDVAVVVSPRGQAVTIIDPRSLRTLKVIRGFGSPHIPAMSPDGRYAYITDDARGTLTAIRLTDRRVVSRIAVGPGAHHLSFRPDQRRLWIALGESARTVVILDASDPARPRLIGRFDPGYPAHDLSFTPDGQRVWVTSATAADVGVFSSRGHRLLFRVPVGPAPQHIAFAGPYAYLTSGYGSTIEKVVVATGRVLERRSAPHGSFELDAGDGYVVTSSLLRGTLAVYDRQLKPVHELHLAQAARDVAIAPAWWP